MGWVGNLVALAQKSMLPVGEWGVDLSSIVLFVLDESDRGDFHGCGLVVVLLLFIFWHLPLTGVASAFLPALALQCIICVRLWVFLHTLFFGIYYSPRCENKSGFLFLFFSVCCDLWGFFLLSCTKFGNTD